jgi:pyrimidine operon attenuation protein/uracil phosphoribosyltransferase
VKLTRKASIMDARQMRRALLRLAHEIVEKNGGVEDLVLIGIRRRGVPLAERIARAILDIEGREVPAGVLDITFYRDDLETIGTQPRIGTTEIETDVTEKTIVLVDDVLYTGRTVRAALDELMDFGRPRAIQLAVLIDRGHRELPIRADYVGKNVPTSKQEVVEVNLLEIDEEDQVHLAEREET